MTMLRATAERVVAMDGDEAVTTTDELGALPQTFEQIYDERYADVERWVRAFGGRSSDIPDLAQEVFIVALRRLAEFEGSNVAGWLYQITRRKMRDYRRLSWIKYLFNERTTSSYEWSTELSTDQLAQLENQELVALMDRILNGLPAEQRAAFVLFELEGISGAEIAQLQQVPLNTVWARIHRARYKLQARLVATHEHPKLKR
jgi:RNA polymerase sigma-70 factor (ECF subfamily)